MVDDKTTRIVGPRREDGESDGTVVIRPDGDRTVVCRLPEEAVPSTEPSAVLPARMIDEGEIAQGGMGSIRRVFDRHILRHVAVKERDPSLCNEDDTLRFLEEAQITGQLDHPNIVPVHDIELDERGDPRSFTMKLVHGRTLSELIRESAPPSSRDLPESIRHQHALALERLLRIFVKVCDAVAFAHSRGVVHRDLKPSNIMVGAHGQVYVMDWGVARLKGGERPSEARPTASARATKPSAVKLELRQSQELPGTVVGTAAYMAPEQARGDVDAIDERTDVFGLGALLYAIVTQRGPYQDADGITDALRRAQSAAITPLDQASPRPIPPALAQIITKALSLDREQRHASVELLQAEVEEVLRGGGWFATQHFAAGEVVLREGDVGECAYIIRAGRCEVLRGGKRLNVLGEGEVFGEMGVINDRPRSATVRAIDDVVVYVITRDALEHELDDNRWLATVIRALARRFQQADRALTESMG